MYAFWKTMTCDNQRREAFQLQGWETKYAAMWSILEHQDLRWVRESNVHGQHHNIQKEDEHFSQPGS